jgi:hypothetical protein
MKLTIAFTTLLIAAGASYALAQGSSSTGATTGGLPSGTATSPSSGAGIPGGSGPGDTTVRPNIPPMNPVGPSGSSSLQPGSGRSGTGLTTRPSSLGTNPSAVEGPTGADGLPAGTPRVMAPQQR